METIKTIIGFFCDADWSVITTIFLGLFAGLIALYKVRQTIRMNATLKWVDDLRSLTSKYLTVIDTHIVSFHMKREEEEKIKSKGLDPMMDEQYLKNIHNPSYDTVQELTLVHNKILLYLNPLDRKHQKVIKSLVVLNQNIHSEMTNDEGFNKDELIIKNKPILTSILQDVNKIIWWEQKKVHTSLCKRWYLILKSKLNKPSNKE